MTKKDIWLLKVQEWYFEQAKPFLIKSGGEFPFGQPTINYNSCKKWYKLAKKWQGSLVTTMGDPLPPPPPPPPDLP